MTESSMQWSLDEAGSEQTAAHIHKRSFLLLPVAISVLLHSAIVVAVLSSSNQSVRAPQVGAVRINLIPVNPQSVTPAVTTPVESTVPVLPVVSENPPQSNPVDSVLPEVASDPVAIDEVADSEEVVPGLSMEHSAEQSAEQSTQQPIENRVFQITPPSLLSVQQSIKVVDAEAEAGGWLYECNQPEEDSVVRTCAESEVSGDAGAYERATSNIYYENLNPVRERSRTERSVRTIYQNTGNIAAALNRADIPDELAGYVLDELAASTSAYTSNGTDRVRHMRRMVDRTAAAQQAERILEDPWVLGRAEELRQRDVHAN